MRLFTAIPLPKEVKDMVGSITRWRLPIPYINTTNLHITLNFFDELSDADVEKVKANLAKFLANQNSFEIEFKSIVKFLNQLHMTVKPNPALIKLQALLERSYEELGFRFQEREYYAHVKLGNLHMDNIMNRQRKMENFPNKELSKLKFRADKVVLFESKLLLHHPKHIPLMEVQLS